MSAVTFIFDGTNWTTGANLGTAVAQPAGGVGGDGNTALQAGGGVASGYNNGTEEWPVTDYAIKTFDVS